MQWLAMLSMLIDHIGMLFYPDDLTWRIVGRLAFPLYAYGVVVGFQKTRDRKNYVARMAALAILAQIAFWWIGLQRLNVLFTFLAVLFVFWIIERTKSPYKWAALSMAAAVILEAVAFEYGSYALLLMMIYRGLSGYKMVAAHGAVSILYILLLLTSVIQVFSVLSSVLILLWPDFRRPKAPVWLWRSFYPAHLILLAMYT